MGGCLPSPWSCQLGSTLRYNDDGVKNDEVSSNNINQLLSVANVWRWLRFFKCIHESLLTSHPSTVLKVTSWCATIIIWSSIALPFSLYLINHGYGRWCADVYVRVLGLTTPYNHINLVIIINLTSLVHVKCLGCLFHYFMFCWSHALVDLLSHI